MKLQATLESKTMWRGQRKEMWEDLNLGHKGRTAQIQDGKSRLVVLTSGKLSISVKACLHTCVISRMREGLPCRLSALPLRGNDRVL